MEIIPVIHLENRKIFSEYRGKELTRRGLEETLGKDDKIYVLDHDGLDKNKPNLCTFPKLSKKFKIFVDCGPREPGDVVDEVLAGASSVVIRKKIWPNVIISELTSLTEVDIYYGFNHKTEGVVDYSLLKKSSGLIILNYFENNNASLSGLNINTYLGRYPILIYVENLKKAKYLEKIGVDFLLLDISKTMGL